METFLLLVFAAVAALTAVLELSKRQSSKPETTNRDFIRFRNNYVLVYALMMGASVPLAFCPSSLRPQNPSRCHMDGASACFPRIANNEGVHVQRAIGYRVPMCMRCINTMALTAAR